MHETVVAQSILETVLKEAERLGRKPVSARISCGELNPINEEALNFAFGAISAGTAGEGIRLDVATIPLRAICKSCGHSFDFDIYSRSCGKCAGNEIRFEADAPLMLEEIEFEDDDRDEDIGK